MAFCLRVARRSALLVLVCLLTVPAVAQQPPELTRPVNDFAGVIDESEETRLDDLIRKLTAASGDVIVVATVKTFQPAGDIRTYANEMFENGGRGIGQKGRDNGMLVLLAVDDRQIWNEVGYDLEGIITDGFAGETSRETMRPYFQKGDYGGGLLAGVTVFAQRIAQARNVTLEGVPVPQTAPPAAGGGIPFIVFFIIAVVIINIFRGIASMLTGGRRGRRRRRRWGSMVGPFGVGYGGWHHGGGGWSGGGGFGGGFGGFGGGRSGGGGGGASW